MNLRAEMDRLAAALPFSAARGLMELGVPRAVVGQLVAGGMLGLAGVDLLKRGRFALGGPTTRLIMAVRGGDGGVTDLVALSSTCPDEWALLTGDGVLLGEDVLEHAIATEQREVRLYATPLAWLKGAFGGATASGCLSAGDRASSSRQAVGPTGICVLDWGSVALSALRGLRPWQTIVTDPGAGPKLEALLRRGDLPMVAEDRPQGVRRAA
jgi:hypothetical protein